MFAQSIQNQISLLGGNQNNSQAPSTTEAPAQLFAGDKPYSLARPAKFRNSDGWEGQSYINANGYTWSIYTCKARNGGIYTSVTTCKINKSEGMFTSIDMGMMMGKPANQDFKIPSDSQAKRITEDVIKNEHNFAVNLFLTKLRLGELAEAPKPLQIGQVVFTSGNGGDNKRAIYEVINEGNFKTVYLDGSRTSQDDHIRPFAQRFGIGVYYNEGETITVSEIERLLALAYTNMEAEAEREQEQLIIDTAKATEKKAYLAQFKTADKRTTSTMLKAYILREYPTVSKVSIKSDSFSGGDSIDVTYFAPEKIEAIEELRYKLRYGSFDGMNDIYNHNEEKDEFIVDGYIMETYKYASIYFEQSDEVRENKITPQPTTPSTSSNGISVNLMSDKGGIEVKFASKPSADVLDKLKSLGFRWSRFNSVWWANQSSERKLYAMQLGGITEDTQDEAGAMVQANEDTYFDNFCQQNNI